MKLSVTAIVPKRSPLDTRRIQNESALALTAWAGRTLNGIANYPPQAPTVSGYRRTGTLGRNWKMTRASPSRGGLSAEVFNGTSYARWVQSRRTQTGEMRRRGWRTIEQIAQDESKTLNVELRAAFRR